jgi:cytochrome P450
VLFERSYTMKMGEVHMPSLSFYIVNDLPLVKRIMGGSVSEFPKHRFLRALLDPLIGESVFSASGQEWERQREMVHPAFSHAALATVLPLMAAAVEDCVTTLKERDLSRPIPIDGIMTHVAADTIYRTMFSRTLEEGEGKAIHAAFQRYQRQAQSASMLRLYRLPTLGYQSRTKKAAQAIHAVFAPLVQARYDAWQEHGDAGPSDILHSLLKAKDHDTDKPFSYKALMEQVATIFLAGHETAASAMGWALYLLASCPEMQERVRDEEEAVLSGSPSREAMKGLAFTRNVFRETLRLYPPLSFFLREVVVATEMRGKLMQPGAMLVVSPWLTHRNAEHWSCPHGFDPDRFERTTERSACRDAYMPYGKGPRTCVGAGFAQQEGLLLITAMVRAFHLSPDLTRPPEPISRLTLRASGGIWLYLKPRSQETGQ